MKVLFCEDGTPQIVNGKIMERMVNPQIQKQARDKTPINRKSRGALREGICQTSVNFKFYLKSLEFKEQRQVLQTLLNCYEFLDYLISMYHNTK